MAAKKTAPRVRAEARKNSVLDSKKNNLLKQALGREKQTRVQILQTLATTSGLSKTQVEAVFSAMAELMQSHMKKRGSGEFTIPMAGIKVRRIKKKATKTRTMVSPLTGQEVTIAGKPARNAIKISALKILKTSVNE